jgi:membrane fusion protein (multidrug efflux system)
LEFLMTQFARAGQRGALALFLLILLQIGCQGGAQAGHGRTGKSDSTRVQPVPVETRTISRMAMSSRLHVSGVLSTERSVQVYSLVPGHVAELMVEEGDRVQEGDTLLSLEDAELLLNERRLRLERDKSSADLSRLEALARDSLVPQQDVEAAAYAADRAYLVWESAQLQVERSRLGAPISGVVSLRNVQVGDYVNGSSPLYTLVDDREVIAVVDVPERELLRLEIGQEVIASLAASGDSEIRGWIKRIAPTVDPSSGTVRVTIGLPNPDGRLRSGMYARFGIITETRPDAIVLPKQALIYDRDQLFVWIAGDSLAEKRRVTKGFEDEWRVEALKGVDEGESLIIIGQAGLKSTTPIRVIRANGIEVALPDSSVSKESLGS